jgi:hypothetical protein
VTNATEVTENLAVVLLAANEANLEALLALGGCDRAHSGLLDASRADIRAAYRSGFAAALATVAVAYGLAPSTLVQKVPTAATDGCAEGGRCVRPGAQQPLLDLSKHV